jgi:phosphoglycolate phosphatase
LRGVTSSRRRIKGLLIDKDGTILDYARTWVPINRDVALFAAAGNAELAARLLRAGGQDPDTNQVLPGTPFAAAGIDGIAECLIAALDGRQPPADFIRQIDRIFQEGGARHSVLIDGARDAIVALKQRGFALGLATNDSIGGMQASLARHEMMHHFDFTVGCDSGHGSKPAPGMVLAFAEALSLDAAEIAVIGDSTHDLEMAKNAGAGLAIAVLSGTGHHADLAAHADVIVGSLIDVTSLAELD